MGVNTDGRTNKINVSGTTQVVEGVQLFRSIDDILLASGHISSTHWPLLTQANKQDAVEGTGAYGLPASEGSWVRAASTDNTVINGLSDTTGSVYGTWAKRDTSAEPIDKINYAGNQVWARRKPIHGQSDQPITLPYTISSASSQPCFIPRGIMTWSSSGGQPIKLPAPVTYDAGQREFQSHTANANYYAPWASLATFQSNPSLNSYFFSTRFNRAEIDLSGSYLGGSGSVNLTFTDIISKTRSTGTAYNQFGYGSYHNSVNTTAAASESTLDPTLDAYPVSTVLVWTYGDITGTKTHTGHEINDISHTSSTQKYLNDMLCLSLIKTNIPWSEINKVHLAEDATRQASINNYGYGGVFCRMVILNGNYDIDQEVWDYGGESVYASNHTSIPSQSGSISRGYSASQANGHEFYLIGGQESGGSFNERSNDEEVDTSEFVRDRQRVYLADPARYGDNSLTRAVDSNYIQLGGSNRKVFTNLIHNTKSTFSWNYTYNDGYYTADDSNDRKTACVRIKFNSDQYSSI